MLTELQQNVVDALLYADRGGSSEIVYKNYRYALEKTNDIVTKNNNGSFDYYSLYYMDEEAPRDPERRQLVATVSLGADYGKMVDVFATIIKYDVG